MPLAVSALTAFALAGCSQIDALAPVGGDQLATVRFATNDVLVGQGVDILVAPVCAESDSSVTCHGTTVGGEEITATSDGDTVTVTVGARTLYDGSVSDVVNAGARPQP